MEDNVKITTATLYDMILIQKHAIEENTREIQQLKKVLY